MPYRELAVVVPDEDELDDPELLSDDPEPTPLLEWTTVRRASKVQCMVPMMCSPEQVEV
jgi:hypothetical protein